MERIDRPRLESLVSGLEALAAAAAPAPATAARE